MSARVLTYRSPLEVSAAEALAWHAQPGAFERLAPPWANVRVLESKGTLHPGDRKRLSISYGPIATRWNIEHEPLVNGIGFADRQTAGPFASWLHEHRFQDEPRGGSWLEDRLTYRLPFGALGDFVMGARMMSNLDRSFAFRHQQTQHDLARHAANAGRPALRIAITGATGLVGKRLVPFLETGGHTVLPIVRKTTGAANEILWNPEKGTIDANALEGCQAVIHLAGESIAGGRWSAARKERIRSSRVKGTSLLARTIAELEQKPEVFVSTSAVGFYGDRSNELLTERSATGSGFLAEVCRAWESAADPARAAGIRVVHPRLGVVFAGEGGMLKQLSLPFKLGLGGRIGNGKQYVSWIAIEDLLGILLESVMNPALEGPVNAVAPAAVTNAAFTRAMGGALHRPTIFPIPGFAARLAFGEMADELLLVSQRAEPARLEEIGFRFRYPEIEAALKHELNPEFTNGMTRSIGTAKT